MKPKSNFVVEVKKSRRLDGTQKKRSLWAGVDIEEAKRHDVLTSGAAPAPAAKIIDQGEAAVPASGPQPRILPIIVESASPKTQTAAAAMPEALSADPPDDPVQPDDPAEDDPGARPRVVADEAAPASLAQEAVAAWSALET